MPETMKWVVEVTVIKEITTPDGISAAIDQAIDQVFGESRGKVGIVRAEAKRKI